MSVTLYVIPGSHPARTARLMLEYKGIDYRRVDLPPVISRLAVRRLYRFPGDRVPAMKIDGRRVQGSRQISRELDSLKPEPPLFPNDPEQRRAVEEAERWGDEVLQQIPRTISWWAFKRHKGDQASFIQGTRLLGMPPRLAVATSAPIIRMASRLNTSTDENVRETIAALPAALDKIDGLIAEGVIGGERPNAADFQIATSLRLLMAFEDIAPAIERRPAGQLARRVVPEAPGHISRSFPDDWLKPLQEPAVS
jgi:glutathione S-transferase